MRFKKAKKEEVQRSTGGSPLHYACTYGHVEVAKWLVKHGADVHKIRYDSGFSPYTVAIVGACDSINGSHAMEQFLEILKWLLKENNVPVDLLMPHDPVTPLYYAARRGKRELVRTLVHCGANTNFSSPLLVPGYGTPLSCAAQRGDLLMMSVLVGYGGSDVHQRAATDGGTALHAAAQAGHIRSMEWLVLEGGADVNATTGRGDSALHLAVHRGLPAAVLWLATVGMCDIEQPHAETNETALQMAANTGNIAVVTTLVGECAAFPDTQMNDSGFAALHCAIVNDNLEVIRYFVEKSTCNLDLKCAFVEKAHPHTALGKGVASLCLTTLSHHTLPAEELLEVTDGLLRPHFF